MKEKKISQSALNLIEGYLASEESSPRGLPARWNSRVHRHFLFWAIDNRLEDLRAAAREDLMLTGNASQLSQTLESRGYFAASGGSEEYAV